MSLYYPTTTASSSSSSSKRSTTVRARLDMSRGLPMNQNVVLSSLHQQMFPGVNPFSIPIQALNRLSYPPLFSPPISTPSTSTGTGRRKSSDPQSTSAKRSYWYNSFEEKNVETHTSALDLSNNDSSCSDTGGSSTTTTKSYRNHKKPIPSEQKDGKYFERRRRNNMAAKKSRDARKNREDQLAVRVADLEKENAILRAHVAFFQEELSMLQLCILQKSNLVQK